MKKNMSRRAGSAFGGKKSIAIFVLILLIVPIFAFAQTNPCSLAGVKGDTNVTSTLPRCVNQIYVWSLGISVLLAMLMIVLGGYFYMTSGGNAEQSAKGKEYITSALIGVVILFCAYLLLNTINPDLVKFNLDSLKGLDGRNSSQPGNLNNSNASTPNIRESDCQGQVTVTVEDDGTRTETCEPN